MNLSYEKTRTLLSLVRRELRDVDPWGNAIAVDHVKQLRDIETALLEWMNNGSQLECNDPIRQKQVRYLITNRRINE